MATGFGKIASIKKQYSEAFETQDSSLAKKGYTRVPGTTVYLFPYKELSGFYRTGLDENAVYIERIPDAALREAERERVKKTREKLEKLLNVDLGPRSEFWDFSKSNGPDDLKHVQPAKLVDGINIFDFTNPMNELTFSWLRVHPKVASSYEAWLRGDYPYDTQFYVLDDEYENVVKFNRKQEINNAVIKLENMSHSKRLKIARQLGLPMSDDTKPEAVYNAIDDLLKQTEFKSGKFAGLDPVRVFNQYADMSDNILHIKDLITQAITFSIYRKDKAGRIMKGDYVVSESEEELLKKLIDENSTEELIGLEKELKAKKIALV